MEEGLRLMAIGMGTVFAFLALLVGVMNLSAWYFERFGGPEPEPESRPASPSGAQAAVGSEQEIAVVLAAVEAWRQSQAGGGR